MQATDWVPRCLVDRSVCGLRGDLLEPRLRCASRSRLEGRGWGTCVSNPLPLSPKELTSVDEVRAYVVERRLAASSDISIERLIGGSGSRATSTAFGRVTIAWS